jgi:hypothetical protein
MMASSTRSISYYGLFIFIAFLFAISCSRAPSKATAKNFKKDMTITRGRVGEIRLGMNPNGIYEVFGKKLTRLVDLQLEGMYSPAIELFKTEIQRDNPEIIYELDQNKVWRIQVNSPQYRTDKGIGVGSTFGNLRQVYRIKDPKQIIWGEEGFYGAVVEELGMSFSLDVNNTMKPAQIDDFNKTSDLGRIPDNTLIDSILVH